MRCVSLDLDGTLLNSNHEITPASQEAIRQLQANGVDVILNTGRAYQDVVKVPGVQEMNCPIICVNGSVLYSKTGKLLYEATLPLSVYKRTLSLLRELNVGVLVYTNHGGFPSTLPPLHSKSKEELEGLFQTYDYDQVLKLEDVKIYKLIALVHAEEAERIAGVKEALAGYDDISTASSFPNNVEITSTEAQKGKALRRYELMHNLLFDEIYAFGDGGNDISQFEIATQSVAMANAPEEVKAKATIVTKSNDEDGVSYAITDLLKLV
ncbi:Cof-type HAD-IIB family hydrolase [Ectobacillus funiculus]|uniref:Cof-type HAD-IIB family hydrolase n=1 Tax=Ectobacillus funiculus TaxID=137993 RepID=UPI00397E775F